MSSFRRLFRSPASIVSNSWLSGFLPAWVRSCCQGRTEAELLSSNQRRSRRFNVMGQQAVLIAPLYLRQIPLAETRQVC